jgi:hypothetical protein
MCALARAERNCRSSARGKFETQGQGAQASQGI